MFILEYIWIDGYQKLRSKIKVVETFNQNNIINNPEYYWNFDGSSTGQSITNNSDLLLKPVFVCKNPFYNQSYLILCDVWIEDTTPHQTNKHINMSQYYNNLQVQEAEPWFGIEQEYFIMFFEPNSCSNYPYGWNKSSNSFQPPFGSIQGPYYCSVGSRNALGREIAEQHMLYCLDAGIKICGLNAEVAPGQWEFQIGICNYKEIGHQLWVARYILERVAEKHNCWINFHPKPVPSYNGSGCHTNFSTKKTREEGGISEIHNLINKLEKEHNSHIEIYGDDNNQRLTGTHETSSINTFSRGNSDRTSSIRIPINVIRDGKGYFEDRRPASNMDPYLVCSKLIETCIL